MAKNGLHLLKPSSISYAGSGSSGSINTNGSITFSSVSSIAIDGIFNDKYDNYMMVMRHSTATGNGAVDARLRSNSTEVVAANYAYQRLEALGSTVSASRDAASNLGPVGYSSSTLRSGSVCWFYGPYLAQPTAWRSVSAVGRDNAWISDWISLNNQNTQFDGIALYPGGGQTGLSGLVCFYGLRK